MKTSAFVKPLRAETAPAATPVATPPVTTPEQRRPFRLWMTGSLAVVMAAMVPLRQAEAAEGNGLRLLRHSRFDVTETVLRIEAAARGRGLTVLARVSGARPVIVLTCAAGGTLVVMQEADSPPAVPMSMLVHAVPGGGADVRFTSTLRGEPADWQDLPVSVADDLAALPAWVAQALA